MSAPEFSRIIDTGRLGTRPAAHAIEADPEECRALARRFGLDTLGRLSAEIVLAREPGGGIRLDGSLAAVLTQHCVLTLAPVPATVNDRFAMIYRTGIDEDEADRLTFETEEDVAFEALSGDAIDIGEVVAQQLSIVMDPYPKAESASLEVEPGSELPVAGHRPFAVLGSLTRKA